MVWEEVRPKRRIGQHLIPKGAISLQGDGIRLTFSQEMRRQLRLDEVTGVKLWVDVRNRLLGITLLRSAPSSSSSSSLDQDRDHFHFRLYPRSGRSRPKWKSKKNLVLACSSALKRFHPPPCPGHYPIREEAEDFLVVDFNHRIVS